MTKAEREQDHFLKLLDDEQFIKNVKEDHSTCRRILKSHMMISEQTNKKLEKQFLKWVLKQTETNFYVMYPVPEKAGIILYKKNLKVFIFIALSTPHPDVKKFYEGYDYILEILNLNSVQKGEGYKVMKKVIDLTKRMGIPASLWTETVENVKYFERYGFVNHGKLGDNNEYLMSLYPSQC